MLIQNICCRIGARHLAARSSRWFQKVKMWENKFPSMKNKGAFETTTAVREVLLVGNPHVVQARRRDTRAWTKHGQITLVNRNHIVFSLVLFSSQILQPLWKAWRERSLNYLNYMHKRQKIRKRSCPRSLRCIRDRRVWEMYEMWLCYQILPVFKNLVWYFQSKFRCIGNLPTT